VIAIYPLTPDRWPDMEALFGPTGGHGGCWCMFFRARRSEQARTSGARNKQAMKAIVDSGEPPGLIAYVDGEPAAWVSLDDRERYPHIVYSRTIPKIDDRPTWSIVCFVVGKRYRRQGLMRKLIDAAVAYAQSQGARMLEAYPVEPDGELTSYHGFTGIASAFAKAGFREVARTGRGRPVVRLEL
jgi:GNAT superfamily N-acetyltransferase